MQQGTEICYQQLKYLFIALIPRESQNYYLMEFTKGRTYNLCNLYRDEMSNLFKVLNELEPMATAEQVNVINEMYTDINKKIYDPIDVESMVALYSDNRVYEPQGLKFAEAVEMIDYEMAKIETIKLKKSVLEEGYRNGMLYGETWEDRAMNIAKLNKFLRKKGRVKKDLDEQTDDELRETFWQIHSLKKAK